MRKAQQSDNELKEQLKAEQARFKALQSDKETLLGLTMPVIEFVPKMELLRLQLADSAEEIAFLYKKLHPYFPVGTCPQCGSVTTKIIGSGRNHWGCLACDYEGVE